MAFKDAIGAHRTAGIPVTGAVWRDARIDGDDVAGMIFKDCVLERVRLTGTSLWQTMFVNCTLDDCEFMDCRLFRTQWVDCVGSGIRIAGGEFAEAVFANCRFAELKVERSGERIVLGRSEFGRVAFNGDGCAQNGWTVSECGFDSVAAENAAWQSAAAIGLDFSRWSLAGACFDRCMFVSAVAEGIDLSGVRFERCNLVSGRFGEARFRQAPGTIFAECDCDKADFAGAELGGALFSKASAVSARFEGADLNNAMFPNARLAGANFSGAMAQQGAWIGADLTGANFEGVDAYRSSFRDAVFKDARVDRARFEEADLHGVEETLDGADLRNARGSVEWRVEVEAEARRPPGASPA